MLAASISLANNACRTVGLALIAIISGSTPCFCNSFLSSITQIGLLVGLNPAQASLSLSCPSAGEILVKSRKSAKIENVHRITMVCPSQQMLDAQGDILR